MQIIGISHTHGASACLLRDGKIVAVSLQEKFDYIKNSSSFPTGVLDWLYSSFNLNGDDIDAVAISSISSNVYPIISKMEKTNIFRFPKIAWDYLNYKTSQIPVRLKKLILSHFESQKRAKAISEIEHYLSSRYGISKDKIYYVEHHKCHAYTGAYGFRLGYTPAKRIILTLDGEGDNISSTVSVADLDNGELSRISYSSSQDSLGWLYSRTTEFLGMKAVEHEYKVMGLAPYVKEEYGSKTYERYFKNLIALSSDKLSFKAKFPTYYFHCYLITNLLGHRFDNIAYSIQRLTEELITAWVDAVIDKIGINSISTSGGVFMNVKTNMHLGYNEKIKDAFFVPSCGDESNCIGAALYLYKEIFSKKIEPEKSITHLYLGPKYTTEEVLEIFKKEGVTERYKIEYISDIEGYIAELLSKGKIVARFRGPCEFGARALGNRSILADPSKMSSFYVINEQIKQRDFWMPFAPTILHERSFEYIENPLKREAPYMILAFRSTMKARKDFVAAIHQGDHTLRPQLLRKEWNPNYYRLIKEFESLTGIGGVLNTSLNIHGYPLVSSPMQAIHVMDNSKLEYLAIEDLILTRK